MYSQTPEKTCCITLKRFIDTLRLLSNITGFVLLCILVNWTHEVDYENLELIHHLSIATLVVLCVYIFIASIVYYFIEKNTRNGCAYFFMIFVLLLWIARYILFVILMFNVEKCDLDSYNKKYKRSKIENLRKIFHGFAVMEIISGSLDQLDNLIPELEKKDD